MAPRFSRLETRVSSRVDSMYGEPLRIQPKAVGEFVSVNDSDRPAYDAFGVIDFEPKVVQMKGVGRHDGDYADVEGGAIHISIHESKLPTARAQWPRQGDTITLTDRTVDNTFQVASVEPDGIGRMICRCRRGNNAR